MQHCVSPGEDRPHTVYRYTDQIYKVIQWKTVVNHFGPGPVEEQTHHDEKLDSSISRTRRVILEKALCNPWEWFCTLTISEDKFDRSDLIRWRDSFTQWIRDLRKKGIPVQYLIVPECHSDGFWHAHGLLSGIPESELISFREMDRRGYRSPNGARLPKDLRFSEYMNWPAYQEKFGYCSLGRVYNPVACGFYMTKYMTKDRDRMVKEVGLHSYYVSKNLNGAEKHLDFYGRDPKIDNLLVNKYEFCSTGMTHVKHNLDWTFCNEFVDITQLEPLDFQTASDTGPELEAQRYYDFEQIALEVFFHG